MLSTARPASDKRVYRVLLELTTSQIGFQASFRLCRRQGHFYIIRQRRSIRALKSHSHANLNLVVGSQAHPMLLPRHY